MQKESIVWFIEIFQFLIDLFLQTYGKIKRFN